MRSKRSRLDRYLSQQAGLASVDIRPLIGQGRVLVDGTVATGISQVVDEFSRIELDDTVLQAKNPVYIMLNKPVGVVSATRDEKHRTVIDLLRRPDRHSLHIAGRLDFNSSGLLLLTNDGKWSRRLASPEQNIPKLYRVTLEKPVKPEYIPAFAKGMYFPYEGITTRPAQLRITGRYSAEVILYEGRYHQIKRMFGRFRNRVEALHRTAIGKLELDPGLAPGKYRALTQTESLAVQKRSIDKRATWRQARGRAPLT